MSRHADGRTHPETDCLAVTPFTLTQVNSIYGMSCEPVKHVVDKLCLSHERLRAELDGMNTILNDDRNEVRSVLQMLDELAELWGDEGKFRTCRDRLRKIVQ